MRCLPFALLLLACAEDPAASKGGESVEPEPLNLPADLAENGVPVGVMTLEYEGLTVEVWYPAAESARTSATEAADFMAFVPAAVTDLLPSFSFPLVETGAVRDAPLRPPEAPYPVVFFSHGFGGTRLQSVDFTVHLASRGYVVVATDHHGRSMTDLLPCLFTGMEGCDLSGFSSDPGAADLPVLADWSEEAAADGFFAGALDLSKRGLAGHSAGGGSTATVGSTDTRFSALMPMAAGAAPDRDVPTLLLGASCDSFATDASMRAAATQLQQGQLVHILGAGHLAPSDLCELDLKGLADELLVGRDDVNAALLSQLVNLASDGCPGIAPLVDTCGEAYLPLEVSDEIIRAASTGFFDAHLRETGGGVDMSAFSDVEVVPAGG